MAHTPEVLMAGTGITFVAVIEGPEGVTSRLVQAPDPDTAAQALTGWPEGSRAWLMPLPGVHHYQLSSAAPTGPDGEPLLIWPQAPCPACKGDGAGTDGRSCRHCGGLGKVRRPGSEPYTISVLDPRWIRQRRPYPWPEYLPLFPIRAAAEPEACPPAGMHDGELWVELGGDGPAAEEPQ
jgi:hypothetical protein